MILGDPRPLSPSQTGRLRIFGNGRYAYTNKGLAVERLTIEQQSQPGTYEADSWVPADTQSADYLEALETIPRCECCRAVRWYQDTPCQLCAVLADNAFPEYE